MAILQRPLGRNSTSRYLRWAARAASRSEHPAHKMGAVIVDGGRYVTRGWNKNRSHPRSESYNHVIHAELDALLGERWNGEVGLLGMDMYVIRITKAGAMATSRPCKDCWILLKETGIRSVTYIDENGEIKTEAVL